MDNFLQLVKNIFDLFDGKTYQEDGKKDCCKNLCRKKTTELHDVMLNLENKTIKCLDKGFVTLVDVLPRLVPNEQKTADYAVVQMARVSYGEGTKTINEDKGLIRYLMRHNHTTPFEGVVFKFHCKLPIFCARQIIRHRTASVNEQSGRYSILKDEFFFPSKDGLRQQSVVNKQGGDEVIDEDVANQFLNCLSNVSDSSYSLYETFLNKKLSREQARMMLPVNLYTEWYWQINLHNLLHFLALRCDEHAQYETRVFAEAMLKLITPIIPVVIEAWNDYHDHRGAMKLTRLEIEALKTSIANNSKFVQIDSDNKREKQEWLAKAKNLGLLIEG